MKTPHDSLLLNLFLGMDGFPPEAVLRPASGGYRSKLRRPPGPIAPGGTSLSQTREQNARRYYKADAMNIAHKKCIQYPYSYIEFKKT
ncbi:MAG: hypothetical protein V4724_30525 [Pseudomonadota bacterium]